MRHLILPILASTLVACDSSSGSGDSNSTPSQDVKKLGIVQAEDYRDVFSGATESDLTAFFLDLDTAVPSANIFQLLEPPTDTCIVGTEAELDSRGLDDDLGTSFSTISAGDVVTVSSPAGSFLELPKIESNGIFYASNQQLEYPLPSGLTADIPGDDFPAFTSASIPDVEPIVNAQPADGDTVTANTQFTWEAGSDPEARITLSTVLVFSSDSNTTIDFSCSVADDGFFEFPDSVKAELGDNFASSEFQISRDANTTIQQDDVLLVLVHSRN